jgi:glycosyltransferase involved in cell wall biosynthesis
MITIVHCTRDIDQTSGGPARSVPALAAAQVAADENVRVILLAGSSPLPLCPPVSSRLRVELVERDWTTWLAQDAWILEDKANVVVHVHGLWNARSQGVAKWTLDRSLPLVISPRGMLEPQAFRHKRLKKLVGWYVYQRRILRRATLIHVTASQELTSTRGRGIRTPAVIAGNGVEVSMPVERNRDAVKATRYVCFLGRLHPIKNLLVLLEAWSRIDRSGWQLRLAGMDEDHHQRVLEQAVLQRGLTKDVVFLGQIEGESKAEFFRDADLFVLPSLSENFGISIAEALASGVPVIASRGTPWRQLETHRCGWWVPPTAEALAETLRAALALSPGGLAEMGLRGQALIRQEYLWPPIASKMLSAYHWALRPDHRPDWIQ